MAGDINNTGLVEVEMGTSLREIVFDIGGGIPKGKKFKAAQTGGPSGGCLTADHLDTPITYETLQELGSMVGSGGLIIMDEDTCMVDIARYFLDFTRDESCGKCSPCRIGTTRMLELLERITRVRVGPRTWTSSRTWPAPFKRLPFADWDNRHLIPFKYPALL